MPNSILITYLDHSGFCVAVGSHLLIFDYYNDEAAVRELSEGIITPEELAKYERVSVFVTHSHADHCNPVIRSWADKHVEYILSYEVPPEYEGHRMAPGDSLTLNGMSVQAFGSTDLGVTYLVEVEGYAVFHAGDLNWWHWREESTPMEIEQAENDFKAIMEDVIAAAKKLPMVDVAFFPLDPRQRSYYDAGAGYFAMSVHPRTLIPMHFMGRGDVALDFARKTHIRGTKVVALTKRGQQRMYSKPEPTPFGRA